MMGNWMLGIPKASQNQQAAADFIKWMLQADTQKTYAQNNGIPSRTSVLKDPDLAAANPYFPVLADALQAPPNWRPRTDQWNAVETIIGTELNAALAGQQVGRGCRAPRRQARSAALMAGAGYPTAQQCEQADWDGGAVTSAGHGDGALTSIHARGPTGPQRSRQERLGLKLLLPVLGTVVVIATIPFILAVYPRATSNTGHFVGLANFERAIANPRLVLESIQADGDLRRDRAAHGDPARAGPGAPGAPHGPLAALSVPPSSWPP